MGDGERESDVPRSVSVHVDGIMEALVKIYDAHRVAKELTGRSIGREDVTPRR